MTAGCLCCTSDAVVLDTPALLITSSFVGLKYWRSLLKPLSLYLFVTGDQHMKCDSPQMAECSGLVPRWSHGKRTAVNLHIVMIIRRTWEIEAPQRTVKGLWSYHNSFDFRETCLTPLAVNHRWWESGSRYNIVLLHGVVEPTWVFIKNSDISQNLATVFSSLLLLCSAYIISKINVAPGCVGYCKMW